MEYTSKNQTQFKMEKVKTLIIGSGPAGYSAAIYAGRSNLSPILYSGLQPGGQLTTTTLVENFPGYPNGVDGNQLMMDLKEQASRFGAEIRDGSIDKVDFSKQPYLLTDDSGNEISADTVIIATGASAKYLGLPDEKNALPVTAFSIGRRLLQLQVEEIRLVKKQCTFHLWLRKYTLLFANPIFGQQTSCKHV